MGTAVNIQTVSGKREITKHDRILVHEHIFNRFPYWLKEEMTDFTLSELQKAANAGLSVVCDLTTYTKPYNYYQIIEKSPVSIVSCIGFYTPQYVPVQLKAKRYEEIVQDYSKLIEKGAGRKNIHPGILKVAARSDQLSELETKFFHVMATLSHKYNLPIGVHAPKGALSHVEKLLDYGVRPEKIFVAHVETGIARPDEYKKRLDEAKKIMDYGAYIQLADFGCTSGSSKTRAAVTFCRELLQEGYLYKVLLSGDSCWRYKDGRFYIKEYNHANGKPYTYTIDYSLPMIAKILPEQNMEQILLHDNPMELFR